MINYRDHRGSLADSLATSRQYEDFIAFYNDVEFDSIEYYGYDKRCNQILFIVKNKTIPTGFIYVEIIDSE